jgi:hypothetical protein
MNFVGRTIEICGKATTTASTATIVSIQFQWDSMGMNTAGKGVQIGNLSITPVAAFSTTKVITFCEQFMTTVAGATATAGSINSIGGYIATSGVASAAAGKAAGSDADDRHGGLAESGGGRAHQRGLGAHHRNRWRGTDLASPVDRNNPAPSGAGIFTERRTGQ